MAHIPLPYLTADIPGTGGILRATDDDFFVEELLAYEPEGSGDHVFATIEKRGLTTSYAAELMAKALDVRAADVGWAGMKDKHAVTRQTFSLPPPSTPEAVLALSIPGITVLSAARHRHKLRTGHLRGNRFVLRVRSTGCDAATAAERAHVVLTRLATAPGAPNWYGEQRFGNRGDNADIGRALVLGTALPPGVRRPKGKQMRLFISALQSHLFNEYVRGRMSDGLFATVLAGDVMQKCDSGGMFTSDDPALDTGRLLAGEIAITGPMFGHKFRQPPAGSPAFAREESLLATHMLTTEAFARVGKLGLGTRRPIAIVLEKIAAKAIGERAIELCFELPSGSYATAVMREVIKEESAFSEQGATQRLESRAAEQRSDIPAGHDDASPSYGDDE